MAATSGAGGCSRVPQRGIDHLNGQSLTKVEACDRFPLIEANAISRTTTCRQGLRWRQGEIPVAVALIKIAHVKKLVRTTSGGSPPAKPSHGIQRGGIGAAVDRAGVKSLLCEPALQILPELGTPDVRTRGQGLHRHLLFFFLRPRN